MREIYHGIVSQAISLRFSELFAPIFGSCVCDCRYARALNFRALRHLTTAVLVELTSSAHCLAPAYRLELYNRRAIGITFEGRANGPTESNRLLCTLA